MGRFLKAGGETEGHENKDDSMGAFDLPAALDPADLWEHLQILPECF